LTNIQFNDTATSNGAYILPINPVFYDAGGPYYNLSDIKILHGASSWQRSKIQNTPRILTWSGLLVDSAYSKDGFADQVSEMESWIGNIKYVQFNSLEDLNSNWPSESETSTANWKKCRIMNVIKSYSGANRSGYLEYDNVGLIIQPEE